MVSVLAVLAVQERNKRKGVRRLLWRLFPIPGGDLNEYQQRNNDCQKRNHAGKSTACHRRYGPH